MSEPAWHLDTEKGLEIAHVEDVIPDLSEVFLWVLNQMQAMSHFLGESFEGVKQEVIALFMALE